MIVIGYQGIGKSTLAGPDNNCIDLESGNFWIEDEYRTAKRADDWYKPYCNIANHLSAQGFTVFTSSHKQVREELKKSKEFVVAIVPDLSLKDEWVAKLEARYNESGLDKDYKAWKNAEECYEENIEDIMNDIENMENEKCYLVVINSMDYNLKDIINDCLRRLKND